MGGGGHVALAGRGDVRAVRQAEGIKPAGAQGPAAVRRVQQVLDLALQHGIVVGLVVVGLVVVGIDVPGPVTIAHIALQPAEELAGDIVLVPGLVGQAHIAAVPEEGGRRVRARGQKGGQVRRNERVGHRNGGQVLQLGQALAAAGGDGGVHIEHLAIGGDVRRQLIVELGIERGPVEGVLDDGLRSDGHADIAADDGIAAAGRALVVDGPGLGEQGTVVVEAEVQGPRHGGGDAIAGEQAGHRRLGRQVGGGGHEGPLTDIGGRRHQVEERPGGTGQSVVLGVAHRGDQVAPSVGEGGAEGHVGGELGIVALGGVAVLHVGADAFELLHRDEVDHAGHGVGAIDRRGPAGDHVHAGQDRFRDQVDVDIAGNVRRGQAPAVQQDEVPVGAQAVQVHRGVAAGALAAVGRRARRGELGCLVQHVLHIHRAALLDRLDGGGDDRARRHVVLAGDQGAGDHHGLDRVVRFRSRLCGGGHQPGGRDQGGAGQQPACQGRSPVDLVSHRHLSSPCPPERRVFVTDRPGMVAERHCCGTAGRGVHRPSRTE